MKEGSKRKMVGDGKEERRSSGSFSRRQAPLFFSHFKSSRQRDSDDDDIVPATDVEDESSCMAALSRWSRVERQLGHSEKATGAFISSSGIF